MLVRVEAVGICGSDMHAYHGHDARRPAPLILGHEAAGRIVTGPREGERVTINPLVTCRACPRLRGRRCTSLPEPADPLDAAETGAFAEYVCVPEDRGDPRQPAGCESRFGRAGGGILPRGEPGRPAARSAVVRRGCLVLGGGAIGLAPPWCSPCGVPGRSLLASQGSAARRAEIAKK